MSKAVHWKTTTCQVNGGCAKCNLAWKRERAEIRLEMLRDTRERMLGEMVAVERLHLSSVDIKRVFDRLEAEEKAKS